MNRRRLLGIIGAVIIAPTSLVLRSSTVKAELSMADRIRAAFDPLIAKLTDFANECRKATEATVDFKAEWVSIDWKQKWITIHDDRSICDLDLRLAQEAARQIAEETDRLLLEEWEKQIQFGLRARADAVASGRSIECDVEAMLKSLQRDRHYGSYAGWYSFGDAQPVALHASEDIVPPHHARCRCILSPDPDTIDA
jgi:hypothetical protein